MTRVLFKFWINTPAGKFEFRRQSRYRWLMRHTKRSIPDRLTDLGTEAPSAVEVCRNFGWTAGEGFRAYGSIFVPLNIFDSDKQKGTIKYRCPKYDLAPANLGPHRLFSNDDHTDKLRLAIMERARNGANWSPFASLSTERITNHTEPQQKELHLDIEDISSKNSINKHVVIKSVSTEPPKRIPCFSLQLEQNKVLHFENIQTLNAYLALVEQE